MVILGAGAAGIGIARLLRDTFRRAGLEAENLTRAVASLDSRGLVADDEEIRDAHKRDFAWPKALAAKMGLGKCSSRDLLAVVRALQPTVLIGTSGEPDTFTEAVVREMGKHVKRPVIFPMSNPTSKSEAKPADILAWTDGRALIATGSPFDPLTYAGRTITIGQGNNVFIFPGVGLGARLGRRARHPRRGLPPDGSVRRAARVVPEVSQGWRRAPSSSAAGREPRLPCRQDPRFISDLI